MRDRDESRRQGYGPRSDEGGDPDQWRHREDQDEWRHGSRWMHGSDRGWDRGGGWRPEDRHWEQEETGYGPRAGEGYQGGYNMGMNYGQGGPQGQGFGPGQPARGYPGGHSGGTYGGFGGHGYSRGEGSWRQGRWETGPGPGRSGRSYQQPDVDDRGENLRRGYGMSPYGGYGAREQGAYAGDEERGTWGGSGYQGAGYGDPGGAYPAARPGKPARAPRGYQRSDERIREDVCDVIIRMGVDAGDVEILVDACEVTLSGTVESRQDKRRLEDLAESVFGVKHVHNQLRVEEPPRGRPASAASEAPPPAGGYGGAAGNAGKDVPKNNRTQ
jgi:hypothetical protein